MKNLRLPRPNNYTRMTRQEYNNLRGWELPSDENGNDAGVYITYENGHKNWLPDEMLVECIQAYADFTF